MHANLCSSFNYGGSGLAAIESFRGHKHTTELTGKLEKKSEHRPKTQT
jgi:hypothetical protein